MVQQAGIVDIYDRDAFSSGAYPWNGGRALARRYRTCERLLYVLLLLLLAADVWWMWPYVGRLGMGAIVCTPLASLVLYLGVRFAVAAGFGNRVDRMPVDERHDYTLAAYHHLSGNGRASSQLALTLARLDVQRARPELARLALGHVETEQLSTPQLKLYYLLRLATDKDATRGAGARSVEKASGEDWYARYTGIGSAAPQHFPKDETVRSWASAAASPESVREAIGRVTLQPRRRPFLSAAYGIMLAHCVFFLGVFGATESGSDPQLRVGYEQVGGALAASFLFAVTVMSLVWLWRWRNRTQGAPSGVRRGGAIACNVLLAAVMLLLCGYLLVAATISSDGTERVIATGQTDASVGRSYDYLAVEWHGYGGNDVTSYYRACDPILMESWTSASSFDGVAPGGDSPDDQPAQDAGSSADAGSLRTQTAQTSDTNRNAIQNEMLAVYNYLQGQGTLPDMAISYDADAKGNLYATVSAGTEDVDGTSVSFEHRLYDNGERVNDSGVVQEEFVLEKVYPNGERDTELEGFYLVDLIDQTVTDEHRTTW